MAPVRNVRLWTSVWQGFSFPPEAGYPLDPETGPRYFMMETHYSKPLSEPPVTDSSGLRLFYTPSLRPHDAGVLSVGLDPNWRHIIPPGRAAVVSEGHCISNCTKQALPKTGINVFATILHTHLIGTLLLAARCLALTIFLVNGDAIFRRWISSFKIEFPLFRLWISSFRWLTFPLLRSPFQNVDILI